MEIRGIELNFSFLDADDLEKFEKAAKKVADESKQAKEKILSMSDVIREECRIIDEFIDEVFGEGTAYKFFNGKKDLKEHIELFEELVKQKVMYEKDLNNTFYKYQPNRAERRANNHKRRY